MRSCMSTWMLTSRLSLILRIGMRSMWRDSVVGRARDRQAEAIERDREGVRQRRLGDHIGEIDAEMYDRLGDLRSDAADDALGAHQARSGNRLEQVLRDQRID